MPARLFVENCVPTGCVMFWLMPVPGFVETFPVPPPPPHAPHVPFPRRQLPDVALPDPNSFTGTSPEIKLAFDVSPRSTYCFDAACSGATGSPGSVIGPNIVPPAVGRKFPAPTVDTDRST